MHVSSAFNNFGAKAAIGNPCPPIAKSMERKSITTGNWVSAAIHAQIPIVL